MTHNDPSKSNPNVEVFIDTLEALPEAAQQIVDLIADHKIILMHGQLGAGKTTLVQQMTRILGYQGSISSPTYSLINEYAGDRGMIYHMDLYRLEELQEALDIGIEDYLYSGHHCFIEWPDLIMDFIEGEKYKVLYIEQVEDGKRKVTIR